MLRCYVMVLFCYIHFICVDRISFVSTILYYLVQSFYDINNIPL
jgi:hypothetical protein